MVLILLLLALGGYTPLFKLLYQTVPGFDKFRCVSRFLYLAAPFWSMLAGIGLDRLINQPRDERLVPRPPAVLGGVERSVPRDDPASVAGPGLPQPHGHADPVMQTPSSTPA